MFIRLEARTGPNRAAEESRRVCQATVNRKPDINSEKLMRLQTADPD